MLPAILRFGAACLCCVLKPAPAAIALTLTVQIEAWMDEQPDAEEDQEEQEAAPK